MAKRDGLARVEAYIPANDKTTVQDAGLCISTIIAEAIRAKADQLRATRKAHTLLIFKNK